MALIDYADKVAVNANAGIPDINKCNASDLNKIKSAVNDYLSFGWIKTGLNPTLTYSSWNATTKIGVINSNIDLRPYISAGMKGKFTQNATVKYFIIVEVTSTQVTIFMGTDYVFNNAVISDAFYSMERVPYGFPMDPNKWSLTLIRTSNAERLNPSAGVWYNIGSLNLVIPVGLWRLSMSGVFTASRVGTGSYSSYALSTTNNGASDADLTGYSTFIQATNGTSRLSSLIRLEKILSLTGNTTYYFNAMMSSAGAGSFVGLYYTNDITNTNIIIKATCAYL